MKFIVAQMGARMHYAVPRMLHEAGMLAQFYTDICATKGLGRLPCILPNSFLPNSIKRLKARVPKGLPRNKITTFDKLGMEYTLRRMRAKTPSEHTQTHLWAGETFCRNILNKGLNGARGVYTFNSAGLELLREASSQKMVCVMEQTIAPKRLQKNLLDEERRRSPEWEEPDSEDSFFEDFCIREETEWQNADVILCGSEFVKQGILQVGGPVDRCVVVPYGVDMRFQLPLKKPHNGPLKVLSVGDVCLRKGAPYVLEAARMLKGKAKFRMVGGLSGSEKSLNDLAKRVELTGLVPRSEIYQHYNWADVFLLPSICEGSATVVYEALSCGLPVICTLNTGSVVRDGIEGFIVPIRDPDYICEKLIQLTDDLNLWQEMSANSLKRAEGFTLSEYKKRLLGAIAA